MDVRVQLQASLNIFSSCLWTRVALEEGVHADHETNTTAAQIFDILQIYFDVDFRCTYLLLT